MTRATAYQILTKHLTNKTLLEHSLATEAVMKTLALRLNEDMEEWGITGLLHDADYEKAKGHPEEHGLLLSKLEPNSIPSVIEHAIQAHNYDETHVMPKSKLDWGITCCDELTGLIMKWKDEQKDKRITSLSPEMVVEKLEQKRFKEIAKNTFLCEEKLGIPLQEFVTIVFTTMQRMTKQTDTQI